MTRSTRSDTALIERVDQTLRQWNEVTLKIKKNALATKYSGFKYCFKIDGIGENTSSWISGGDESLRALLEYVAKELDNRAVEAMTERLTA